MTQLYYGKYLLPEIPVVDGYQYVCIRKNDKSGYFDVIYSKTHFFVNSENILDFANSSTEVAPWNKISISSPSTYESVTATIGGFSLDSQRTIIWTKQDILDGSADSSTVWMKGHEPSLVPYIGVYNSVEDLFDEQSQELTCLVNNSSYDDDSYTITSVPSWIKLNNIAATSIQVNGNSWIGFNGSTEHIKFNRRDTKMYFLWTEEGLLYNHYRFYRIRWRGYSQYNSTSLSNLQVWEVIFFDTGDICIHAISIPTKNYDGSNAIVASATYSYTKLTTDSPYVTFYSQDDNNSVFTIDQNMINLLPPFDRKYLIRSGSDLYTITDGTLSKLSDTEVTSDVFRNNGVDDIPDGLLLLSLVDPEVLYWMDSTNYDIDKFQAIETATPPVQTLYSQDYDITDPTIKGIESVNAVADTGILFSVSFDSGISWKIWNSTEWITLSEIDKGMTADALNTITSDQWNAEATTGKIRFRITIPDANNKFTNLIVNYLN